jgi:hypothetical protein
VQASDTNLPEVKSHARSFDNSRNLRIDRKATELGVSHLRGLSWKHERIAKAGVLNLADKAFVPKTKYLLVKRYFCGKKPASEHGRVVNVFFLYSLQTK